MTLTEFKKVMVDEFQGMDPELDFYYWSLWTDALKREPNANWLEFLDAIGKEKI